MTKAYINRLIKEYEPRRLIIMVTKKSKYDYKKGLIKFAKAAGYVIIAGVAAVYGDSQWYLMIAPLLHYVENYLKHKD